MDLQITFDPTNGALVAAAVAGTAADREAAAASALNAALSAIASNDARLLAEAAAATVNLTGYLTKAGNLDGLGSQSTSRTNLGLGTASVRDVGVAIGNVVEIDGSGKLPAIDGSKLTNVDVLPVGTSIYVNGNVAPTGTIKENGAVLNRADFPRLWAFAQTSGNLVSEAAWGANLGAFSTGDIISTFRIPDSRGYFIRGFDNGAGVDPGRSLGQLQLDAFKVHNHQSGMGVVSLINLQSGGSYTGVANVQTVDTGSTGGDETRPKNVAKLVCIKY
ncbi:phage tail protein [Tardiphaga sp. 866_E4_N2_1]|uniref:phage tail protein n=1 Tax=unclassified Tardiphaga TaxID=2631404 RepID=UPI003F28D496